MKDKPEYCYSSGCPLANKGRGFSLGSGDPSSPISIMFERPADDEIAYTFGGPKPPGMSDATWDGVKKWQAEELERRRIAFPELDTPEQRRFLMRGAPVRGASGAELRQWVLPTIGGKTSLEDYYLENVLHCAAKETGDYPKAGEREAAEGCCAHWNRLLSVEPRIDVNIISLHPAGLIRETGGGIVALPLQIDSFVKARAFSKAGKKVLLLAGGAAAKFWLNFGDTVTKWCGHYETETEGTWKKRMARIAEGIASIPFLGKKKPRKKKEESTPTTKRTGTTRRSRHRAAPIPGMEALGQ